jgi:hypothetical protein
MKKLKFYIITPHIDGQDELEFIGTLDENGEYTGNEGTGERIQEYVERYGLDLTDQEDRESLQLLFRGHYSGATEEQ